MQIRCMSNALTVGAALFVVACGGDPTGSPSPPVVPSGSTFSAAVQPILTANCAFAGCHAGATPQQGMNLSAGQAYANLVGVPSQQVPRLSRVAPGNPDSSYVILKLEGAAGAVGGVGTTMPLGGELTIAEIATIRAWVSAGAAND